MREREEKEEFHLAQEIDNLVNERLTKDWPLIVEDFDDEE